MAKVPNKVSDRIMAGMKRFVPILESAKSRDVNESDTVMLVTDILQEVFGYDKYSEITSEFAIRGTYCDLAIKIDGKVRFLIEVKAIGLEPKESYIKQAVDYAANSGIDWVILTNANTWNVYKVAFTKPIAHELVLSFHFIKFNYKNEDDIEKTFLLTKEAWNKDVIHEYHSQKQIVNKYTISSILMSESVLDVVRREVRRLSEGIKIDREELLEIVKNEVFKRELVEGDKADAAKKMINKAANKAIRLANGKSDEKLDEKAEQKTNELAPRTVGTSEDAVT